MFQPLGHQPQARAVKVEHLEPRVLFVGEGKDEPAAHIGLEIRAHRCVQVRSVPRLARAVMVEKAKVFALAEDVLSRVPKLAREEHKEFARLLSK